MGLLQIANLTLAALWENDIPTNDVEYATTWATIHYEAAALIPGVFSQAYEVVSSAWEQA